MFSFFRKKSPPAPESSELRSEEAVSPSTPAAPLTTASSDARTPAPALVETQADQTQAPEALEVNPPEPDTAMLAQPAAVPTPAPAAGGVFSFFRKKAPEAPSPVNPRPPEMPPVTPTPLEPAPAETVNPVVVAPQASPTEAPVVANVAAPSLAPRVSPPTSQPSVAPIPKPAEVPVQIPVDMPVPAAVVTPPARKGWMDRLKAGLRKTGASIAVVFTGTQIGDALYEELEDALLMADTGVKATEFLLADLKKRVKNAKATDPAMVKVLLAESITAMLKPLEKTLVIGEHKPTVIMVAGVNGAGKTTSIGKLTRHLANEGATVLLAAADTFRAAAREQLAVWADRNTVEIITQEGGDPAAVSFDAVTAGRARGRDVVLVDTAGRLPTQLHLMEELRKIKRVVQKADPTSPHEVLLVIDGNTGQNALAQVKSFDDTLDLTGLIITKLDGTAKGGVICAIAREKPIPIYFIGVGEKLEDLETFSAREFAQALLT